MTKTHGVIAIVGAPNAGKSTLTNNLLGQKISIVSPKVQTTRNAIKAIIVDADVQLILVDTPGIFIPRSDKILERTIAKTAWQALRESNHICFLVDGTVGLNRENLRIIEDLKKENLPLTIVINKIDLVKKSQLLQTVADIANLGFEEILLISAKTSESVNDLKKLLLSKCNNPDFIYDEDQITDAPMRFIASEITREKLFLNLDKELPYSLIVQTEKYEVLKNKQVKIHQTIFVPRESHKNIVVGKNGSMIKEVGLQSRKDLEKIIGHKVHLFLFVKVADVDFKELQS